MNDSQDKPKKKKDVDALLSEVTGAAPKKPAKKAEAGPAQAKSAEGAEARPKSAEAKGEQKTIRIRMIKSGICAPVDQKLTLKGLGLNRIRQEVVRVDSPTVRGQILKVRHLVAVVGE